MSTPSSIENALIGTLETFCRFPVRTWLRSCNNQADAVNDDVHEQFPQIFIVASGKSWNADSASYSSALEIMVATHINDDPSCTQRGEIYTEVERVMDKFLYGDRGNEEVAFFEDSVRKSIPTFCLGGIIAQGGQPSTTGEVHSFTLSASVEFTL